MDPGPAPPNDDAGRWSVAGGTMFAVAAPKLLILLVIFIGVFASLDDFDNPLVPILAAVILVPAAMALAVFQIVAGVGLLRGQRRSLALRATWGLLALDLVPALGAIITGDSSFTGYAFTLVLGGADVTALILVSRTPRPAPQVRA